MVSFLRISFDSGPSSRVVLESWGLERQRRASPHVIVRISREKPDDTKCMQVTLELETPSIRIGARLESVIKMGEHSGGGAITLWKPVALIES